MTPAWRPRGPRLEERERIRLILAEAVVRYENDQAAMWGFVRGMVNFNGSEGDELVGVDLTRAIHRQ